MSSPTPSGRPRGPRLHRGVCYLSRSRGWIDPADPRAPTSHVNLLAVATGAPVWSLGTAWKAIFRSLMPATIEDAYRKAMVRSRLSEAEIARLRTVAERLSIELRVSD